MSAHDQRRRVAAAEERVNLALAELSAPNPFATGTFRHFREAEDRHEALVNAEADLLREQAKLSAMEQNQ
ncbi:hypothetical protein OLX02_01575 [Novosphingobium sp. KCTC 2891]|uniref:hypothetical protein n=1 Tax=Novosphingobium sp. KCTC 2891 TaxID=2989730 RepID=UPI002223AEB0|nr:hypothetical protein [Novosphingobium sp. KCTC 2891]MCW1381504.1 hypothetical protein [Novosphingobium sp. KCTC 2891]